MARDRIEMGWIRLRPKARTSRPEMMKRIARAKQSVRGSGGGGDASLYKYVQEGPESIPILWFHILRMATVSDTSNRPQNDTADTGGCLGL